MALISLSDWLDRFGDAPAPTSTAELDSLRFAATEVPTMPDDGAEVAARADWRDRLRQAWSRAFWRLRRLPSGQA